VGVGHRLQVAAVALQRQYPDQGVAVAHRADRQLLALAESPPPGRVPAVQVEGAGVGRQQRVPLGGELGEARELADPLDRESHAYRLFKRR
jgi:hypothetical protein